jgi:hypothetical protein
MSDDLVPGQSNTGGQNKILQLNSSTSIEQVEPEQTFSNELVDYFKSKYNVGRKLALTPAIVQQVYDLAKQGLPVKDISYYVGIERETFYKWYNKGEQGIEPYNLFTDAIKKARAELKLELLAHAKESVKKRDSWEGDWRHLSVLDPAEFNDRSKDQTNPDINVTLNIIREIVQHINE